MVSQSFLPFFDFMKKETFSGLVVKTFASGGKDPSKAWVRTTVGAEVSYAYSPLKIAT